MPASGPDTAIATPSRPQGPVPTGVRSTPSPSTPERHDDDDETDGSAARSPITPGVLTTSRKVITSNAGTVLELLKEAGEMAQNLPYIQAVAGLMLHIIKIKDEVMAYKDKWNEVMHDIGRIQAIVEKYARTFEEHGKSIDLPSHDVRQQLRGLEKVLERTTQTLDQCSGKRKRDLIWMTVNRRALQSAVDACAMDIRKALQYFQTELSLEIIHLGLDSHHLLQDMHTVVMSKLSGGKHAIAPKPENLTKHLDLLDDIVASILEKPPARIAILGSDDIEMTSLALALLFHDKIQSCFGDACYFIACDAIETKDDLKSAILNAFGLSGQNDDADLGAILKDHRGILSLTNIRHAWDSQPDEIEKLLVDLAAIPSIYFCITFQGSVAPANLEWTMSCLIEKQSTESTSKSEGGPSPFEALRGSTQQEVKPVVESEEPPNVEQTQENGNNSLAATLRRLGDVQLKKKHYKEAEEYLKQAFELCTQLKGQSWALAKLAEMQMQLKNFDAAKDYLNQAFKLHTEQNDVHGQAMILRQFGDMHLQQKHYDEAISHFNNALELQIQQKHVIGQAFNLQKLGETYHQLKNLDKAEHYFDKALELYTQEKSVIPQSYNLHRLGTLKVESKHFDQAEKYFQKGVQHCIQNNYMSGQAWHTQGLGDMHLQQKHYEEATSYLNDAFKLQIKTKYIAGQAWCMQKLGEVQMQLKHFTEAEQYFTKALALRIQDNDLVGQSWNTQKLGEIQKQLRHFDKAEEYFKKVLELHTSANNIVGQVYITEQLGEIQMQQQHYDEATQYFNKALELNIARNNIAGQSCNMQKLGEVQIQQKNFDEAEKYLKKALTLWSKDQ